MNFEVYGQNSPITPEAGGKKAPFFLFCQKNMSNKAFKNSIEKSYKNMSTSTKFECFKAIFSI